MIFITPLAHAQYLDPLVDSNLIQDLADSAQVVSEILPPTDTLGVGQASARVGVIAGQSEALRIASEGTRTGLAVEIMQTPAEIQGLANRIPGTPGIPGTPSVYSPREREFEEGSNVADIAAQMLWDWGLNVWDFYVNWESEWEISGLCKRKSSFFPRQKYWYPAVWFEQSSDMYRGKYLEQMIVRPLFKEWIEDGTIAGAQAGLIGLSGLFDDRYEMAQELAPREINRVRAISDPKEDGTQKTYVERTEALISALGSDGDISSLHEPLYALGKSRMKDLYRYGEVSARGRNVESYRFVGLSQYTSIPTAFLGNWHTSYSESIPFVHRTDNPLIYPYTRNQSTLDLLLLIRGQPQNLNLGALPGNCLAFNYLDQPLTGTPGAMGVDFDGEFGLLSKIHPDEPSLTTLALNANSRKCLRGSSIYPLTNFVAGGKNFKNAFYTKFLRMNKLSDLYSFGLPYMRLPMFHHYSGYGSRFRSKIQIHDSSFDGDDEPHRINLSTLSTPWTNPGYNNEREAGGGDGGIITGLDNGRKLDIGSGVEWHRYDLCRPGYRPLYPRKRQIKGHERYTG